MGLRVYHLLIPATLALVFLLYTSYHQQHRLSYALHADQLHAEAEVGRLHSIPGNTDWHAVWTAARVYSSEHEFVSAMRAAVREEEVIAVPSQPALQTAVVVCPPQRECPVCAPPALTHLAQPTTATTRPASRAAPALSPPVTVSASNAVGWMSFASAGQAPPISKALAHSVAVDGTVVVTWANYALWDFVKTWVFHAKDVGLKNFLVGAMDAQIGRELMAAGVPCFAMFDSGANHSGVGSDHLQWGGEAFHKMGRQKIALAQLFLGLGLDLLLVDVDVVLLGNVMTYFGRYPQADILVTTDQLASTIEPGDDGLELPDRAQAPMNIGLMFFRFSQRTVEFVNKWLATINADATYWDQNAFNDLVREEWDPIKKVHPNQRRIFMGAFGTLAVGVLPVASFSGGHTYFVQRLFEVQRVKPYAVHCTFQYGANPGKRNRLREAMLFEDPPEYYTEDTYITVDLRRVPYQTWAEHSARNTSAMQKYHYRGLDMQLESVWPAIRVAAIANRSIIVPKLACYCDKYWTELDKCRVPGATQTRIPFLCPMDHVLDPIFMNDDVSKFKVRWREHSFLENPRCPDGVRRSKVTFYSSTANSEPIEKWVIQEGGLVVLMPANLTEGALKEALKPYTSYKVWHLKDPEIFFGAFENAQLREEVEKRISHLKPIMPKDPSTPSPSNYTAPPSPVLAPPLAPPNLSIEQVNDDAAEQLTVTTEVIEPETTIVTNQGHIIGPEVTNRGHIMSFEKPTVTNQEQDAADLFDMNE